LAGDLDHAKGEPEKTKNANGSGISFRQKIAEIKLSAYALWGPFATIPNQDGSGTRCAQTALAEGSIRDGGEAAPNAGEELNGICFE
jgi:hypothetical protein